MNINEAKTQIKNAVSAYFLKDEFGNYLTPLEKQRPLFIEGEPGIGKTAIIEQIASEMNIGLVSYSMTHHTRQSALGLPFIVHKKYGDSEYDVSEYTMSEIIASIYEYIETTGKNEGILFLDEINCVSETLSPVMLQFLQYKVFGKHHIPYGWIVVTAGNPPEFNNSVHEFDVVTRDRLRTLRVEPDFETWKKFAYTENIHPAIISYLEIKKQYFYKLENTVDGKQFVTARGWSDLSQTMNSYEKMGLPIDRNVFGQFIHNRKISSDFSGYYELFKKYRSDYSINNILNGKDFSESESKMKNARFDERISVISLLLSVLTQYADSVMKEYNMLLQVKHLLLKLKENNVAYTSAKSQMESMLACHIKKRQENALNVKTGMNRELRELSDFVNELTTSMCDSCSDAFEQAKPVYNQRLQKMRALAQDTGTKLSNAFRFIYNTTGQDQEMMVFLAELTVNRITSEFICTFGSDDYRKYSTALSFYERQNALSIKLDSLNILD